MAFSGHCVSWFLSLSVCTRVHSHRPYITVFGTMRIMFVGLYERHGGLAGYCNQLFLQLPLAYAVFFLCAKGMRSSVSGNPLLQQFVHTFENGVRLCRVSFVVPLGGSRNLMLVTTAAASFQNLPFSTPHEPNTPGSYARRLRPRPTSPP